MKWECMHIALDYMFDRHVIYTEIRGYLRNSMHPLLVRPSSISMMLLSPV